MTHFASELRQNPKTRLRSVLLRLDAGPPQEADDRSPRSAPEARARRRWRGRRVRCCGRRNLNAGVALLHACNAITARLDRLLARLALHLPSASVGPTSSSVSVAAPGRPQSQPPRRNRWSRRRRAAQGAGRARARGPGRGARARRAQGRDEATGTSYQTEVQRRR
jgi:hypothetical protein